MDAPMNEATGRAEPLSLQDKLDQISHERQVLAQLRELARQGLHDGDRVVQGPGKETGRVIVLRSAAEPCCVVELADGRQVPFDSSWRPAPPA
jgi:hypothetical protein